VHPVAQQLDQLFGQLDPKTASLLEKVIQDAVELARRETPVQQTDDLGYPIGYFEATAGSFADEPLERPANLPLETREPW